MPVVQLVLVLIVVGVILWLVNTYVPMSRSIKTILNAVVVILVILYVLAAFGVLGPIRGIRIGRW